MKNFARVMMCGLFATTLAFTTACGDDEKTPADTTPDATETAAETVAETVEETAAETVAETVEETAAETVAETVAETTAETVEEVTPTGACNNAADLAIIGSGDKDPSAKASECGGTSCIAKLFESIEAFESCVNTCMLNAALPNYSFVVSEPCTSCYTGSVVCTAEFCGLNDPNKSCVPASFGGKGTDSVDCSECRDDNGCVTSFYSCSGLTPPTP